MSIIDKRTNPTDLESAETELRTAARRAVIHARKFTAAAQAQAARYGRDALQAQLGDDAAEFAGLYNDARDLVQTFAGDTIPTLAQLPADPIDPDPEV
mgnify:CR=1 FL=1